MMDSILEVRSVERSGGLLDASRRLVAALWEHAEIRLELLSAELAEERSRVVNAAVAAGLLVVFAFLACTFVGVGVIIAVWDTSYRLVAAIALPILFVIGAFMAFMWLRRLIARKTPLFRHSLAELRRDVEEMRDAAGGPGT